MGALLGAGDRLVPPTIMRRIFHGEYIQGVGGDTGYLLGGVDL